MTGRNFTKYAAELKRANQTLSLAFRQEYEKNKQFQNFLNRNAEKYNNETEDIKDIGDVFNQEGFRFIVKVLLIKYLEFRPQGLGLNILDIIFKEKEEYSKNMFLLKYSPVILAGLVVRHNSSCQMNFFCSANNQESSFTPSFEISDSLNLAIGQTLEKIDSICTDSRLFKTESLNVLGNIYEYFIGDSQKKSAGKHYTPDFIIEYILEKTLAQADVQTNPYLKVIDPACGCGHFLFRAYDLLKEKFRQNLAELRKIYKHANYTVTDASGTVCHLNGETYWQEENLHYHLLSHSLFGADIDAFAAQICSAILMTKEIGSFKAKKSFYPQPNIINCDSLTKWELDPAFTDNRDFWLRKYDYVVGNPPYVSFGLKRTAKLKTETAVYLRLNYPNSAEYKISYYALFLERAIEILAPGGQLGFITPDSFLLGRYFSKIRRFILENCFINELVLLNQPVFAANVGFPVISLLKKKCTDTIPANRPVHLIKAKKWFQDRPAAEHEYPQSYFENQPYFRFRLFFSALDKFIVDKMDSSPNVLKDVAQIRTGLRSLTSQKDIIWKTPEETPPLNSYFKQGIISSAEVKRFFITYRKNWLNIDPAKLNSGGWDKAVIENRKILIRQTGNFLIAAIDVDNLYHLNNVHSLSLRSNSNICLEYILCLINSDLLNYYYQTVSLEAGRAMAQTDIETLEKLPLVMSFSHQEVLTRTAKKLKKGLELFSSLKNSPASEQVNTGFKEKLLLGYIKKLSAGLNKTVYNLYGLTNEEIHYVEGLYSTNNLGRQA